MKDLYQQIISEIGEKPEREGLMKTPERAANAIEFLTGGYKQTLEEVTNKAVFDSESHDMIIVKDIEIYSLCEHHILPFFGKCHIGYIPRKYVLGVSKLARIADMYARRLQIQERLTNQISEAIMNVLKPDGVGVVIEAKHFCMMMRGVEKQNSSMTTSAMKGIFRDYESTRSEFINLINN